ncbi:MAG: type II toxin-antitoxin system ParD family antitoxin [Allorhizobium sp.]
MGATSFNLGKRFDDFIDAQVKSGRYASADEVVREALEGLQEHERKLTALRDAVDVGLREAEHGQFAEDDFLDNLVKEDVEDAAR